LGQKAWFQKAYFQKTWFPENLPAVSMRILSRYRERPAGPGRTATRAAGFRWQSAEVAAVTNTGGIEAGAALLTRW
jgi:hypothetical protein